MNVIILNMIVVVTKILTFFHLKKTYLPLKIATFKLCYIIKKFSSQLLINKFVESKKKKNTVKCS